MNLETNLNKAMSICDGNFIYMTNYSSIYTFTTENINGYIKYFDLKNKSLLTVGSSGDQILNAFFLGARDITLYDLNPFAKYYTYLKISSIASLSYSLFQSFFFKHGNTTYYNEMMFNKELFNNRIKPILRLFDYESFLFFDELFSRYKTNVIRDYLFNDDEHRNPVIKNFNTYLKNEKEYNRLKSIINKINFNYINGDIFKDTIPGRYDNIFLSNLCTITNLDNLKKLLIKLDKNNLNNNGTILFAYLWNMYYGSHKYDQDWKDIYKLPLTKDILKDFISEHHQINDSRDYLWEENNKSDLILIYRKN